MQKGTEQQTAGFIAKSRRQRIRKKIVRVLACIVVFCTTYALILPALTLERKQIVLDCALSIHQHTDECCNAAGEQICGQADFVIHKHNENCYGDDGSLICPLTEIAAHAHTDECYNAEKTLICNESAVLHRHSESCYNENGALACGMMQVIEHVHGDTCFKTVKASEAVTKAQVNTVAAGTTETWGYNDDGSIWWGTAGLNIVKEIKENTPYIIMGYLGNTIMANETRTVNLTGDNGTSYAFQGIKAVPDGEGTDYQAYEYWYFEKAEGEKDYYIYCLTADGQKKYLQFTHSDLVIWKNETKNIGLNENKAEATVFKIERVKDLPSQSQTSEMKPYQDHIVVYVEEGSKKFFINSYFGDKKDKSTHFWGYPEASAGSCLKVCRHDEVTQVNTANRLETANSPNSVINLFDYWASENQNDRDNMNAPINGGINENHALKFVYGEQSDMKGVALNSWTGAGKNPRQGIVEKTLGENGYPVLSGTFSVDGYDSNESLEYLFSTKVNHKGKQSYRNVGGMLSIDSEGYYAFDSKKSMAEFDRESGSFSVYDKPGVEGSFFPFNVAPQVMTLNRTDPLINHYFGLTLTTRFVQRHGGHTDERKNTPTTFKFSGDDDVWIFIDGVLVGDVGGIHDASEISINFATGEIKVGVASGTEAPITTTLRECYEAAGRTDAAKWDASGKIYADNSVHTLKFFYLERGNYESNLTLKYNLTEIPKTAIYKVDQYGKAVPNAGFSVYAADENYQMLNDKNGTPVTFPADAEPLYDADGNLVDSNGNILANALYTGVTNDKGEMIFVDTDGMPLSINELEDMFGQHFILRETQVPEGYRLVSKDVHLKIWSGAVQKFLKCENTSVSGSRAAPTLQITATDLLHLRRAYNGSHVVEYCNESGQSTGTLFAVVFKYNGEIDGTGQATQLENASAWQPVWGNDKDGYQVVPLGREELDGPTAGVAAALEAAKASVEKYGAGGTVFTLSPSSTMQLKMENLPGNISKYYSMLDTDKKGETRYTVAYYWTDQSSLQTATPDNTYRVYTFAEATEDGVSFSAFERVFGANIHVPNLINNLMIQKRTANGSLINGATFAIYRVKQLEDAGGTLEATATDGSTAVFPKEAVPNAETGAITTADGKTIMPLQTDTTRTFSDGVHVGTAEFANLSDGQYIVKEIKAPPGYKINKADTMVLVTEDTVYANAGTEKDGIAVGRGPGYLANPLNWYASEGQIDNTLTWVYARMLISAPSTKYTDATSTSAGWGYLTENYTGKKGEKNEAIISYLKYSPSGNTSFDGEEKFNYVTNEERTAESGAQNPSATRRLFTTVGWNHYAILQDYDYGLAKSQLSGANYEDWSKDGENDRNLMYLFSRSSYIMVTDEQEDNALVVKKIDAYNETVGLSNAQFRLYKLGADGEMLYYVRKADDGTLQWSASSADAMTAVTGSDGLSPQDCFTGLPDGTYYLEEVKAPDGYRTLAKPLQLTFKNAKVTLDSQGQSGKYTVSEGVLDTTTNRFVYTVTVPNYTDKMLPETGGSGTVIYIASGLVLTATAGTCLIYKSKKRRKEDTPTF